LLLLINWSSIIEEFKKADATNSVESACVFSGKGVGKINAIEPAFDIVTRVEKEAIGALKNLQSCRIDG